MRVRVRVRVRVEVRVTVSMRVNHYMIRTLLILRWCHVCTGGHAASDREMKMARWLTG